MGPAKTIRCFSNKDKSARQVSALSKDESALSRRCLGIRIRTLLGLLVSDFATSSSRSCLQDGVLWSSWEGSKHSDESDCCHGICAAGLRPGCCQWSSHSADVSTHVPANEESQHSGFAFFFFFLTSGFLLGKRSLFDNDCRHCGGYLRNRMCKRSHCLCAGRRLSRPPQDYFCRRLCCSCRRHSSVVSVQPRAAYCRPHSCRLAHLACLDCQEVTTRLQASGWAR